MKNIHFSLSIAAFLLCFVTLPVSAQQMTGQSGFVPINQVSGLTNFSQAPIPAQQAYGQPMGQPQFNPMAQQQQPQNFLPNSVAPMANQMPTNQGYSQSNLNALSPYEQQELALKESRMLQELEALKNRGEHNQGFRANESGFIEQGYAEKTKRSGGGGFKKAVGKLGRFVAKTTEIAAPAGAYVGSMFIMRAAFGPPAAFMPVATPGGTAFIPVRSR